MSAGPVLDLCALDCGHDAHYDGPCDAALTTTDGDPTMCGCPQPCGNCEGTRYLPSFGDDAPDCMACGGTGLR